MDIINEMNVSFLFNNGISMK